LRKGAIAFSSGVVGGLIPSLILWLVGVVGIISFWSGAIAPELDLKWLYAHIVWSGIWGLLVPLMINPRYNPYWSGVLLGLVPSTVQILMMIYQQIPHLAWGLTLVSWTPFVMLALNAIWGIITTVLYRLLQPSVFQWRGDRH